MFSKIKNAERAYPLTNRSLVSRNQRRMSLGDSDYANPEKNQKQVLSKFWNESSGEKYKILREAQSFKKRYNIYFIKIASDWNTSEPLKRLYPRRKSRMLISFLLEKARPLVVKEIHSITNKRRKGVFSEISLKLIWVSRHNKNYSFWSSSEVR